MKKIFFTLITIFTLNITVNAYECYYNFIAENYGVVPANEHTGYFIVNEEEKKIYPGTGSILLDRVVNDNYEEKNLFSILSGDCPSEVYGCVAQQVTMNSSSPQFIALLIDTTFMTKISLNESFLIDDTPFFIKDYSFCNEAYYDADKSTGEKVDINFNCDFFDKFIDELELNYCDTSNSTCGVEQIENYKLIKERAKAYCNSMLSNGSVINDCVTDCLNLSKEISRIEQKEVQYGECNVSHKLIVFIRNMLRWIKYIIPVTVIIIGILDFIKAIGADKEDEMKKVQRKFVKRLIAAALIFLIPLIIEFVLGKMGFGYDDCGLF